MTDGETVRLPRVHLRDTLPLIVEATPETRIFDNVMRVVTEAINRQQESFMKMFEDPDTSQRHNEVMGKMPEMRPRMSRWWWLQRRRM